MNLATRSLLHRWHREVPPEDSTKRRRAMLGRSRRERASWLRFEKVAEIAKQHIVENQILRLRNNKLAENLKVLSEKILATLREAAAEYLGMPGRTTP